jgi:hypothetical protein
LEHATSHEVVFVTDTPRSRVLMLRERKGLRNSFNARADYELEFGIGSSFTKTWHSPSRRCGGFLSNC